MYKDRDYNLLQKEYPNKLTISSNGVPRTEETRYRLVRSLATIRRIRGRAGVVKARRRPSSLLAPSNNQVHLKDIACHIQS